MNNEVRSKKMNKNKSRKIKVSNFNHAIYVLIFPIFEVLFPQPQSLAQPNLLTSSGNTQSKVILFKI